MSALELDDDEREALTELLSEAIERLKAILNKLGAPGEMPELYPQSKPPGEASMAPVRILTVNGGGRPVAISVPRPSR